jgi:hypothetical protein
MFIEPSLPPEIFIFTPFGVIYPGSPTPGLEIWSLVLSIVVVSRLGPAMPAASQALPILK